MLGSCLHELRVTFGAMPIDIRRRVQLQLILDSHPGAAAHPAPELWDAVDDVDYLYREYAILAREQDAGDVATALRSILDEVGYGDVPEGDEREIQRVPVTRGIVRLTVPKIPSWVPDLVAGLDDTLGPGVATPDHLLTSVPPLIPKGSRPIDRLTRLCPWRPATATVSSWPFWTVACCQTRRNSTTGWKASEARRRTLTATTSL
jgi:hypothetical protein